MVKRKEIVWKEVEKSRLLILKENETVRVEFIDNGYMETTEIIDKKTKLPKEVDKYVFDVKDLSDKEAEKEFSCLSKNLIIELKEYQPLIGKQFSISKQRIGATDFDIQFTVNPLN